jgi:hypothetical protein
MLVKGEHLTMAQRRQVFDAFGYRWTIENEQRARQWLGKIAAPTAAPISDEAWIRLHAFHCTESGAIMLKHAEPVYVAAP